MSDSQLPFCVWRRLTSCVVVLIREVWGRCVGGIRYDIVCAQSCSVAVDIPNNRTLLRFRVFKRPRRLPRRPRPPSAMLCSSSPLSTADCADRTPLRFFIVSTGSESSALRDGNPTHPRSCRLPLVHRVRASPLRRPPRGAGPCRYTLAGCHGTVVQTRSTVSAIQNRARALRFRNSLLYCSSCGSFCKSSFALTVRFNLDGPSTEVTSPSATGSLFQV